MPVMDGDTDKYQMLKPEDVWIASSGFSFSIDRPVIYHLNDSRAF
jgi:hypothetical protein